jgi:hypothetical protein
MKGIVLLPDEWGLSQFDMHAVLFDPRDGGDRSADLPGDRIVKLDEPRDAWEFSFPPVRPGIYFVTIDPPGWTGDVDARLDGVEDARLEVPRPARVSVQLTQAGTHVPASVGSIHWRNSSSFTISQRLNTQEPTAGTGWFEFVVPSGRVEFSVEDEKYASLKIEAVAYPKLNKFEFSIERACGFVLRARNAGVQLSVDPKLVVAAGLDNAGGWTRVRAEGLDQRFTVTGPGRYRIGMRPQKGYTHVKPKEIVIPPVSYVDVDLDLECAE